MTRVLLIPWLAGAMVLTASEAPDLMRFDNGDQLHGTFQGLKDGPKAVWLRDDVSAPVDFNISQVRHIILRGGRPVKSLTSLSNVALINGDRIPGKIISLDETAMILETSYAGVLRIPRDQVTLLAPSPLGGRLNYHGPFNADEWKMANVAFPAGLPPDAPAAAGKEKNKDKPAQDQPGRWVFSGSAWYWPGKSSGTALLRENSIPDRAILRFDMSWKNRISLAIGFHADFAKPKSQDGEDKNNPLRRNFGGGFSPGDSAILPVLFGNSYVLQIFSSHLMLFRTFVNEEGVPSVERVQVSGSALRLGDSGKATMEIRSNRLTGEISFFVNDEFVTQWSEGVSGPRDPASVAKKGNGFGFVVQTEDSPVKITDIMVAEWNGMPDAARSLQVDEQDIVLLANGTDRFSGKVEWLRDGKLQMEGKYGRFQFQLDDLAEVRFARNRLAKETASAANDLIVRLSPLGQVSGKPLSGNASAIRILSPICGEINFNLESAVMLDFQHSNNIGDDWDAAF